MDVTLTNREIPLSLGEIQSVETRLGIVLPQQYQDFLLLNNGGVPKPNLFSCVDGGGSFVQVFLAIHEGSHDSLEDYFQTYKVIRQAMPNNIMPIAHDGFGNQICISTCGDDCGSVYFWDHENEGRRPSYKNLSLISPSFDEFLSGLYEDPPAPFAELIHEAFQLQDVEALRRLIASGWDVNNGPYRPDISALDFASTNNMMGIARELLRSGAKLGRALEITRRFAAWPSSTHDFSEMIKLLNSYNKT